MEELLAEVLAEASEQEAGHVGDGAYTGDLLRRVAGLVLAAAKAEEQQQIQAAGEEMIERIALAQPPNGEDHESQNIA